ESAGANPGPACYGRGGPLTLTDVNLLLGLMDPDKAGIPLDRTAAQQRLHELMAAMQASTGQPVEETALLAGLREIGVEIMAEAIRAMSLREGSSPQNHALLAFGGAGPQHACAVAARLGISTVLVPADAGLLSAWGLEMARRQEQRVRQVLAPFSALGDRTLSLWQELAQEATTALGVDHPVLRWLADIRLIGQDATIPVEAPSPDISLAGLSSSFAAAYRQLYGYPPPAGRAMELVALRVVAEESAAAQPVEEFPAEREAGPLLLQDRFSTCVIAEGWTCRRGSRGTLLLEKAAASTSSTATMPAAVRAGLFRSRIEGIVTAMGEMLRRTALSTNVKERLDYSCALLDADGRLVASAPHVPVHLGALGVCVRETLKVISPGPGDVVVTNHPAFGGSHLPDVTVIAPVHAPDDSLLGYVANRAHHAEIGGMAPGSMPAGARCLAEEGVVISPCLLVRAGMPVWEEVTALLTGAEWPTRRLSDNLADLEAQLAACAHGAAALRTLAEEDGAATIREDLTSILSNSAARMAERLDGLNLDRTARSAFDDGTPLELHVTAVDGRLTLDFTGTGPVHPRNLNATPAIVRSTVLFALRLWLGEDLPLNEGLLEAVDIVIPECLLNPHFPADSAAAPAVVGGNVETSQRLCDLLLETLDLAANGPGTMNNFLFGDETFGYYETIAGGSGGGPHHHGSSGRHVHMTNTAITDVEVMEHRYPVRLHEYAIRGSSGGTGEKRGGDGVVRTIEFLRPLTVSFLTQRRTTAPRGLHGGQDGQPGRQTRKHANGAEEILPPAVTYHAEAGEQVRIETPGGGGWGLPGGSLSI
ncbi:MAG: 5-oxoprolinase, partial [Akkermansiaceae bacterium]|nr:5-oxoprolinase [Akkermansiaceae bacterium]